MRRSARFPIGDRIGLSKEPYRMFSSCNDQPFSSKTTKRQAKRNRLYGNSLAWCSSCSGRPVFQLGEQNAKLRRLERSLFRKSMAIVSVNCISEVDDRGFSSLHDEFEVRRSGEPGARTECHDFEVGQSRLLCPTTASRCSRSDDQGKHNCSHFNYD